MNFHTTAPAEVSRWLEVPQAVRLGFAHILAWGLLNAAMVEAIDAVDAFAWACRRPT